MKLTRRDFIKASVATGAQSNFYRELAGLTDRFVRMEMGAATD